MLNPGDTMAEMDVFTDGLWHYVIVDIESGTPSGVSGKVNVTVDGRTDNAQRLFVFTTTEAEYYYIGGKTVQLSKK